MVLIHVFVRISDIEELLPVSQFPAFFSLRSIQILLPWIFVVFVLVVFHLVVLVYCLCQIITSFRVRIFYLFSQSLGFLFLFHCFLFPVEFIKCTQSHMVIVAYVSSDFCVQHPTSTKHKYACACTRAHPHTHTHGAKPCIVYGCSFPTFFLVLCFFTFCSLFAQIQGFLKYTPTLCFIIGPLQFQN